MASRQEAELKQQGAIEAAQDPNTNVAPEDAEQKVLDEARKAGGAALAFNPDASPAEKAAQARSVSAPPSTILSQITNCVPLWPTHPRACTACVARHRRSAALTISLGSIFRQGFTTTINPRPQRSCPMP